jgi:haloacid dehalogenase-like hydrolase
MGDRDESETAAEAERRFIEDLMVRGEAVPSGTDPVPPGATHEIVEERGGMPSKVRRRRFTLSGDLDSDSPETPEQPVAVVFFDLGETLGSPVLSPPPIHLIGFTVFDFTIAVLRKLHHRKLRLGVISNTGDDTGAAVDAVLERAGIRDFFEPALRIYSKDVGLRKDSPAIFRLAADRAGEPPDRCLFVGENPGERAFAEQAGYRTVADPRQVADTVSRHGQGGS